MALHSEKPTEIWELVFRLAKKHGGMVDPTMTENQWKLTFFPKLMEQQANKEESKEPAVQGDTGGGTDVVEQEEEEKKGQENEQEVADLTESVKVQVQLLKVKETDDQFVVEFKNKDYGSQRLFYGMLDFMKDGVK